MSDFRVLVVEPNEVLLRNIAENILQPQGYFPLTAQNLAGGIKAAQAGSPDLILLHATNDDALHFLKSVTRRQNRLIPAILVIDQAGAHFDVRLLKLGVKDYVTWPPVPEELLQAVRGIVDRSLSHNKAAEHKNGHYLKYEFADMASHLMRNPLAVIQTSVSCLQSLELSPAEEKKLLDNIWRQSRQLSSFISELLGIFQVDLQDTEVSKKPVDLPPLIEKVISALQCEEPDKQIFATMDAKALPTATADAEKTEIILSNLLKGAARRCTTGGQILVDVRPAPNEIIVSVKDNGDPIPLQSLENIFQPYYSTAYSQLQIPANYQLGLYTTKKLVELQQGRIWAKPLPQNSGSEFYFSLPIWESR